MLKIRWTDTISGDAVFVAIQESSQSYCRTRLFLVSLGNFCGWRNAELGSGERDWARNENTELEMRRIKAYQL